MTLLNLSSLAFRSLNRNKLRAFLTMLGIIMGVAAVITMGAIGQGSKESISSQLSSMGTNLIIVIPFNNVAGGVRVSGSSFQILTIKDILALKKNSVLLKRLSPMASSNGQAIYGSLNWPTVIMGVDPDFLDIRNLAVKTGIGFDEEDIRSYAKVCILGQTVVDNLFAKGEDPIGKTIRFKKIPFIVIGVLVPKGQNAFGQDQDDIILAPYTSVQKRVTASIYFNAFFASAFNEASTDAATADISKILRVSHRLRVNEENDFTIHTQEELIKTLNSTSTLLTTLLTAVSGLSLLIGGIGIMNVMYVSVKERTKEIGLRLAVGAWRIDILMQFLTEALIISITGGLIGIILGITASLIIAAIFHWPTAIAQSSVYISFAVCVFTGVFFGFYPAQKASHLDPIDALHYE
jgi:putative ABC transport system permease protein